MARGDTIENNFSELKILEQTTRTLRELLTAATADDLDSTISDIRQIMELYRSHAFYPQMGVFQSYYKINP